MSDGFHKKRLAVIKEFQCPGCMLGGPDPEDCDSFKLDDQTVGTSKRGDVGFRCSAHVTGTRIGLGPPQITRIALGLPTGFNKVGAIEADDYGKRTTNIRLWLGMPTLWGRLNLPVWGMFKDGAVFVRTYAPRINLGHVDVIKNDTVSQKDVDLLMELHGTIDVGTFIEDID